MTDSLKTLMQDAEINNSFDIQATGETLKKALENSFAYLYRLQRNKIKFKEYYFPSSVTSTDSNVPFGDLYLDDKSRVCFQIDADLVKQTARDKFYNSDLHKNEFTLMDIENRSDLFERTILVSLDRQYLFNIKLKMTNGNTTVILPYKMSYLMTKENQVIEHRTSVLLIENSQYKTVSIHRGALGQMKDLDGHYRLGPKISGLPYFERRGTYFVSFQMKDNVESSLLYPCRLDEDGFLVMDLSHRAMDAIEATGENFTIHLIFFKDLYEHTLSSGENIQANNHPKQGLMTQISVLQGMNSKYLNMPVPTENTLVFKRIHDGSARNGEYETYYSSGTDIHYPNLYTIHDDNMEEGDVYRFFFFYSIGYDLHYTDKYEFFFDYLKDKMGTQTLEDAVNQAYFETSTKLPVNQKEYLSGVLRKIMGYRWFDYQYDTIDFVKFNNNMTPYEYKVSTMKEFVKSDTSILKDYVRHQNKTSDTYGLFVKNVDLTHRIRKDTSNEMKTVIPFTEDHYVFVFNNPKEDRILDLRVWVDGLLCMDLVHENEFDVDYIYIPTRIVKDDSYIEIEIFHHLMFNTDLYLHDTVTPQEIVVVNDDQLIQATYSDIMIFDENGDLVENEKFNFSRCRYEEAFEHDGKTRFMPIDKIRVLAKDDSVVGHHFTFSIKKNPYYQQINFDRIGYPIISSEDKAFKRDSEYYRIFTNGRLMSKYMYMTKDSFDNHRIQVLYQVNPGDKFALDITPFRNELIYFVEDVPKDGLIDLSEYIDKPFDHSYYDIYLNGRKMDPRYVFPISDTKIQLLGVQSLKHLEIYEKDRDDEYYGWTKNNIRYYFRLDDMLEETYIKNSTETPDGSKIYGIPDKTYLIGQVVEAIAKREGIEEFINIYAENRNLEPKNCDDDIQFDATLRFRIFYYEELLPLRLADPHEAQFNKEYIKNEYPETTDTYLIENKSSGPRRASKKVPTMQKELCKDVMYLDPDINVNTAKNVYFLGDYDEICEALEQKRKGVIDG